VDVSVVCPVDQDRALCWDEREVARRWMALFYGFPLVRLVACETLSEAQLAAAGSKILKYRKRRHDIS